MKALLWVLLFLVVVTGVTLPAVYFVEKAGVPQLNDEFDLEQLMKLHVEGERISLKMGLYTTEKGGTAFERPDFSRLPKDFVAIYISQMGCPTYFQTPREDGAAWGWRMVSGQFFHKIQPGDGRCERYLALRIAEEIGIKNDMEQSIAAHEIHAFLQKDQLLAYELSGTVYARAVVGPEAAAKELFGRPLDQLQLSELAEFALAMPLLGYWDDIQQCKNPSLLRQGRDGVLTVLARQGLVAEERAKSAQAQPLACIHN